MDKPKLPPGKRVKKTISNIGGNMKSNRRRKKTNRKLKNVMKDSAKDASKVKSTRRADRKEKLTTISDKTKANKRQGKVNLTVRGENKGRQEGDSRKIDKPKFRAKVAKKQLGGIKKREARRLKRKVGFNKK